MERRVQRRLNLLGATCPTSLNHLGATRPTPLNFLGATRQTPFNLLGNGDAKRDDESREVKSPINFNFRFPKLARLFTASYVDATGRPARCLAKRQRRPRPPRSRRRRRKSDTRPSLARSVPYRLEERKFGGFRKIARLVAAKLAPRFA